MWTLLAGDGEGVCCCGGEGVTDSIGETDDSGDSSVTGDGVGVWDSCANTAEANNIMRIAALIFVVMSSGVETSLISWKTRKE